MKTYSLKCDLCKIEVTRVRKLKRAVCKECKSGRHRATRYANNDTGYFYPPKKINK